LATEEGVLVRIAATDGLPIQKVFEVGGVPRDTVAAAETIWVTDEFGELVGIDAGTNLVIKRIRLGGAPTALTATTQLQRRSATLPTRSSFRH
jgi:hypothetical protein